MALEGVAEVCSGMLYSTIGDGKQFQSGRQAAAFVGVTPKQHSSGGKTVRTAWAMLSYETKYHQQLLIVE